MTSPTPSPTVDRWSEPPATPAEQELYELGQQITTRQAELKELLDKRWRLIYKLSKKGLVDRRLAYLGNVAHSFVGRVRRGQGRPPSGRD